jgi:hypothetical protein
MKSEFGLIKFEWSGVKSVDEMMKMEGRGIRNEVVRE